MASLEKFEGILGERLAAHLLRRATFKYDIGKIKQFAGLTPSEAVNELMKPMVFTRDQPIDPVTGQPWINNGTPTDTVQPSLRHYVRNWVLNEMRYDEGIHTKLLFFLHKCMVVNSNTNTSERFYDYLALIFKYSTGSFKTLAKKMTKDNLMLIYLNNTDNKKTAPNENYAREFLELFTIGKGPQIAPGNYTNYTEQDVVVGAKLLTGIRLDTRGNTIDPDTGIPTGRFAFNVHNTEDKTFSSAFDNHTIKGAQSQDDMPREFDDYVEMIFGKIETARLYCRRLYRYFVSPNITNEIESDIIIPLAQQLKDSDYVTEGIITSLLTSKHFYDLDDSDNKDEIIGALVKSPLELYLGTVNFFQQKWPNQSDEAGLLYSFLKNLVIAIILDNGGIPYFMPYDVAGYSPYYQDPDYDKSWFTANTIISRYKLADMMFSGRSYLDNKNFKVALNIEEFFKESGFFTDPGDAMLLTRELAANIFPESVDEDRIQYFASNLLDGIEPEDWAYEWAAYIGGGGPNEVRIGLQNLVRTMLFSQEYQLL